MTQARVNTTSPLWVWGPRLITIIYLALILILPAITVVVEAFHEGAKALWENLQQPDLLLAAQLTLIITLIAVPLNTVFGLCAAWVIARNRFWGRAFLLSVLDLPFSISPVVAGLMLVLVYGKKGLFGPLLEALDIKVIFALPGMVMATMFVTLSFVAREVIPVLEEMGLEQEQAARTLGAKDWQIFWRITLPNVRWGLLYGVLLTNARAMGEFGAVSVVSGSILGDTATLPIFVEQAYKNYQTPVAFGAALLLGLLGVVTLVVKEILERKTHHD